VGRRKIVLSPRYLTDAHALRVVGGSPASRALGAIVRALAEAASLPLEGDAYTFLLDDGDLQVLAHSRRVPRCNLWVWYWATDQDLTLVALTNVPPVAR
jgi:hypothetical protein